MCKCIYSLLHLITLCFSLAFYKTLLAYSRCSLYDPHPPGMSFFFFFPSKTNGWTPLALGYTTSVLIQTSAFMTFSSKFMACWLSLSLPVTPLNWKVQGSGTRPTFSCSWSFLGSILQDSLNTYSSFSWLNWHHTFSLHACLIKHRDLMTRRWFIWSQFYCVKVGLKGSQEI